MGKIFANRIVADNATITYADVPATYKAATRAALEDKVASGIITEERLAEILAQ